MMKGKRRSCLRSFWCFGKRVPALDFCEEEVEYRGKVVSRQLQRGAKKGTGVGFVIFVSPEHARHCLKEKRLIEECSQRHGWTIQAAPLPSDLEWQNLHVSELGRAGRCFLFSVGLFLACVLVVSPVTVMDELHPLMENVKSQLNQDNYFRLMIIEYLPPLIVLMINSIVIPYLINSASLYERFWKRSDQQSRGLHMNIFFMVVNSLIIPMMSVNSLSLLLRTMYNTPLNRWNTTMGATLFSTSGSFALRYMINGSLLSNAAQLLQVPQMIYSRCLMTTAGSLLFACSVATWVLLGMYQSLNFLGAGGGPGRRGEQIPLLPGGKKDKMGGSLILASQPELVDEIKDAFTHPCEKTARREEAAAKYFLGTQQQQLPKKSSSTPLSSYGAA